MCAKQIYRNLLIALLFLAIGCSVSKEFRMDIAKREINYNCRGEKTKSGRVVKFVYGGNRDRYCVYYREMNERFAPANVPTDSIEYGLTEFIDLDKNVGYFENIVTSIYTALYDYGYVEVHCIYDDEPYYFSFHFDPKHKHLVIIEQFKDNKLSMTTFAIDLSDVNVSTK